VSNSQRPGKTTRSWLVYVAIAGNVVYVPWILRNGIEQGFRGTPVEVVSWIGLLVLLLLNATLLWRHHKSKI
jgi:hypothetical protein